MAKKSFCIMSKWADASRLWLVGDRCRRAMSLPECMAGGGEFSSGEMVDGELKEVGRWEDGVYRHEKVVGWGWPTFRKAMQRAKDHY